MSLGGASTAWADDQELTVYDGDVTNAYVPVYGNYCDGYTKAEFIMPSTQLSTMAGGTIKGAVFYANVASTSMGNASSVYKVFLKEVANTTISAWTGYQESDVVYTCNGVLSVADSKLTIVFDTPYVYGGGNLLIGLYKTVSGGSCPSFSFKGQTVSGASIGNGGYNSSITAVSRNFLPKTTFTYEPLNGPGFAVDGYSNGATVAFGKVAANATKDITLKNPGTESVTVNIETTGGFAAAASKTIAAGGQETLTITAPSATANGTITMTPTAVGVAEIELNLSCIVVDPARMMADFTGDTWPTGWTYTNNGAGWKFYEGAVYYWNTNYWYSTPTNDIVTTKYKVSGGDVLMFDAYTNSAANSYKSYQTLKVYKSTDGETWGDPIASYDGNDIANSFTALSIDNIPAGSYYFKFTANQICLDNIYGLLPAVEPKNLAVSRDGTTATFTWDAANTETAWQVYIDTDADAISGSITPIDIATTPSKTFTGLTAGSTYYVWVRSNFGGSSYSDWVRTSFSLTYRAAAPTSVDGSGITNVTFGSGVEVLNSNDRPTSSPYYGDYSAQIGGATAGQSSNLAITFSTGYGYGTVVWVDWNQNYEFEDSEIVFAGECGTTNPTTLDASFTVPALQASGNYRMRIAAADSYYDSHKTMATAAGADPYPTGTYCVVHDYTLKVNEASAYSMSITGSDVSENTIAFGTVKNTTTTKTFTINNDGGNDLTGVSVVSSDAEVFTVSETGFDIAVGDHKDITVTFVKGVDGDYNKTITVSQANVATPLVLTVTGTYATPTPATMAATLDDVAVGETVAFGTVNKATTKTFKVSNTGEATLNATIALSGADADKFALSTTSLVVAGGSNETFTVTFDSDEEDVAKTATVTLSAAGLSNVAFNVTGTYSDFWTEDFNDATGFPTGWVITPGTSSSDSYVWHIASFTNYENKTKMAIAPTSSNDNTIITPRLAAKENDVLTWDAYFYWYDEAMTVEWSNDGATGWTKIYDQYKPQDDGISINYYHKAMSFTAPADGNYYLRFTSHYSNGIDNFEGFKLNLPAHIMAITASSIPTSGSYSPSMKATKSFNASVTVKESRGVAETGVVAKVYMGTTVIGTSESIDFAANQSKDINITATPIEAATEGAQMHIEVEYAGGTLSTDPVTRYVAELVRLDMTENSEPTITTGYSAVYDIVTLTRNFSAGWNTFVAPLAINTSELGDGAKVYSFTGYDEGNLSFSVVNSGSLTAATPYIIYIPQAINNKVFTWETPVIYSSYVGTENIRSTHNSAIFQGTYAPIAAGGWTKNATDDVIYGVTAAGKIAKAGASASMKGFRAYFDLPAGATARLAIYDDATGITTILDAKELNNDGKVYNLNGQRVENAHKGLYIVNGKKVVVK